MQSIGVEKVSTVDRKTRVPRERERVTEVPIMLKLSFKKFLRWEPLIEFACN